jgi:hypothetical protein
MARAKKKIGRRLNALEDSEHFRLGGGQFTALAGDLPSPI